MRVAIKVSGKVLHPDERVLPQVVARLFSQGISLLLVHGGGPQITTMME
ncbi:MAG: acetylglutamate kinase, partial [Candidatus Caldatribacteriaceae bacterium]